MLVAETTKPSLRSAPQIRRCPQRGFLRAGRGRQLSDLWRQRRPADPAGSLPPPPPRQRPMPAQSVRGITSRTARCPRGGWTAAAVRSARSAAPSFGRPTWRRKIASSYAPATNKRARHSSDDPPNRLAPPPRHRYWRPSPIEQPITLPQLPDGGTVAAPFDRGNQNEGRGKRNTATSSARHIEAAPQRTEFNPSIPTWT